MRSFCCALFLLSAAALARGGDLIPTDPRFGPLRVASHKVEVTVDNQIAMTRVEQVFANEHPATLEPPTSSLSPRARRSSTSR